MFSRPIPLKRPLPCPLPLHCLCWSAPAPRGCSLSLTHAHPRDSVSLSLCLCVFLLTLSFSSPVVRDVSSETVGNLFPDNSRFDSGLYETIDFVRPLYRLNSRLSSPLHIPPPHTPISIQIANMRKPTRQDHQPSQYLFWSPAVGRLPPSPVSSRRGGGPWPPAQAYSIGGFWQGDKSHQISRSRGQSELSGHPPPLQECLVYLL